MYCLFLRSLPNRQRPHHSNSHTSGHLLAAVVFFVFLSTLTLATNARGQNQDQKVEEDARKCLKKICFNLIPNEYELDIPLRGLGIFTYWTFEVYTGALYVPREAQAQDDILRDTPKVLVLQYHRSIKRKDFIKSTGDMIRKNPTVDIRQIEERLKSLYDMYRDVAPGDRYALRYIPEEGTTLFFNDKPLGTIPGEDFARAVFGIWLSEHSVGEDFTRALFREAV